MLNSVVIIGRLTRAPELRYTPQGVAVCDFGMAVERSYTNREGERETDFFEVTAWRGTAESCANHLGKGRLVAVSGELRQDRWQTEDGQNRSRVKINAQDVRFLDWPSDENQGGGGSPQNVDQEDVPF